MPAESNKRVIAADGALMTRHYSSSANPVALTVVPGSGSVTVEIFTGGDSDNTADEALWRLRRTFTSADADLEPFVDVANRRFRITATGDAAFVWRERA